MVKTKEARFKVRCFELHLKRRLFRPFVISTKLSAQFIPAISNHPAILKVFFGPLVKPNFYIELNFTFSLNHLVYSVYCNGNTNTNTRLL